MATSSSRVPFTEVAAIQVGGVIGSAAVHIHIRGSSAQWWQGCDWWQGCRTGCSADRWQQYTWVAGSSSRPQYAYMQRYTSVAGSSPGLQYTEVRAVHIGGKVISRTSVQVSTDRRPPSHHSTTVYCRLCLDCTLQRYSTQLCRYTHIVQHTRMHIAGPKITTEAQACSTQRCTCRMMYNQRKNTQKNIDQPSRSILPTLRESSLEPLEAFGPFQKAQRVRHFGVPTHLSGHPISRWQGKISWQQFSYACVSTLPEAVQPTPACETLAKQAHEAFSTLTLPDLHPELPKKGQTQNIEPPRK